MWVNSPKYDELVKKCWQQLVSKMYGVVTKLKELKALNQEGFSDVQAEALKAFHQMLKAQDLMHQNSGLEVYQKLEKEVISKYKQAQNTYLSYLKQKAKLDWLIRGDDNTRLFHQSIKDRMYQNKIHTIQNGSGEWVNSPNEVNKAFFGILQATVRHKNATEMPHQK